MTETIAQIVERLGLQTDKTTGHSYGPFYDLALAPYRHRPEYAPYAFRPPRLLEIGVDRAESLRLWDAYFGGAAKIVGVDVHSREGYGLLPPSVSLSIADAYTEAGAWALGDFDIIIDDGPHTLRSHRVLLRFYLPRLKPGGLMVIEDVQREDWIIDLASAVPDGYSWEHIDLTAVKGASDDRLFVVRRSA